MATNTVSKVGSGGYWKDIKNQRSFFDALATKLNIQKPEEWLKVTTNIALQNGGNFIQNYHKNSIVRALKVAYPEHQHVWQQHKYHGYWKDVKNQRAFFDQLATKLNILKPEDWFNVTKRTVLKEEGHFVERYYNSSVIKALQAVYPEHQHLWQQYKARGYWKDVGNQRAFFDQLAKKLNIERPEDWFSVTRDTVANEGGKFVDTHYNSSVVQALQATYPELQHIWQQYKQGKWNDVKRQRQFFDELAASWNITKPEDWLKISTRQVLNEGGHFINKYYKGSIVKALQAAYPEHQHVWEAQKTHGYWKDMKNQRMFFDNLASTMNIQKPEDWYSVTSKMILNKGGYFINKYYNGSVLQALQALYPEHRWPMYNRFTFGHNVDVRGSKSQHSMHSTLKMLFPETPIQSNYRLPLEERKINFHQGLKAYEFDVFLPNLALAFEYQGETHYFSSHIFGKASERQRADDIKRKFAKQMGITLISIPFWWDKSPDSLAITILSHRPDITISNISYDVPPIPTEMPGKLQSQFNYIPNTSKEWRSHLNPTGWLLMEKYDGVRVFWDGKRLHVKSAKLTIDIPQDIKVPAIQFEGELWMGHGKRQQVVDFLHKINEKRNWHDVKIMIFDAPQETDKPYSRRLQILQQNIPQDHPILSLVKPITCQSMEHVERYFQQLCKGEAKAEGIVLRDPTAWYYKKDAFFTKKVFETATLLKVGSGQFKWPYGKITSLQVPDMINRFYVVRYPPHHPEQAHFVSTVISKEDLFHDFFHYYVTKPTANKRCSSCRAHLDTFCIQTSMIYNAMQVNIAFCLNTKCLPLQLSNLARISLQKPFNNLIWVKEEDQQEVKQTLGDDTSWSIEVIPSLNQL